MPDPFEILGVPRRFKLDLRALEQRHRDLSRALHPDRHAQGSPAERRLSIEKAAAVNDAFRTLKSPYARGAALLAWAGRTVDEHSRAEPTLLMEIMELREELEDARGHGGAALATALTKLRADVQRKIDAEESTLTETFDAGDGTAPPAGPAVDRAYAALIKLRYLYRFVEEADAIAEAD